MFMGYAADNLKARGQITEHDVLVAQATGSAYGAAVTLAKFPQCVGVGRHALRRLLHKPPRLIEYK